MEADKRRSDVLGTSNTKYEPRGGILYELETPDEGRRQTIQRAVTVIYVCQNKPDNQ